MEFYVLNQNEEVTATLSTDGKGDHTPVYSATVDEKLKSYDILELKIPFDIENNQDIKEEYYTVFKDIKGWREYIINEVVDEDDGQIEKTITAELSSIELLDEIIQTNVTGNNPTEILTKVLAGTRWTVGTVDASIYNQKFSEDTEMLSALEVIDLLSDHYSAEVSFSYAVAGNKVTKRFVNFHKQMGADNGKRFEVDKDVTSIKRTIDTSALKTAIIPFGKEPEEGQARLDIKNLVWSKAKGDPADKPKGQNWIGDTSALAQWGKNNEDGSRRHRFLSQEIDVETEAELASMAWVQLGQYTKPKTTYEAVAMDLYTLTGDEDLKHEYVNLGDTVVITDFYFAQPLVVQTRVSELKRDLLEPLNNDLVFGDSLELFSTSRQADRLETIKKELSNRIELVRQSADGKSDTYLGSDEPISPNEKDMWYRPHPTIPNETQFLIFNGLTWDIILDTSNLDSVGKEVIAIIEQADRDREKAEADFESAKTAAKAYTDTKASEFDTKVEAVKTDVAATKIKADKAVSDAQTAIAEAGFAKVDATTAKQNAVTAISTAELAKTNAGTALTAAQTAVSNSGTALTNAQTALNRVGEVEEETGTLQTSYDALTKTVGLKADKTTVNGITQTVTQHGLDITANATAVALKADKTAVDTINQTVTKHTTDIKATSDGLALKSDKSVVDSINSTVGTHTTQIKATSDGLALKADSSLVNAVKGTVDTHTTQITATSNGLALKADSSLVNTINGTVNTHTGQISANSTAIAARLTSAQVDSLVAAKKYVNETTLNATANGLSTSITQVSTDLSNLDIGGRNYVIRTGEADGNWLTGNEVYPKPTPGGNGHVSVMKEVIPVVAGEKYTFSKNPSPIGTDNFWRISLLNSSKSFVSRFADSNNLFTFTIPTGVSNLWVSYPKDSKPKIEKGNKATDWSPAPEDMATLEKFTTLNATVDGIQTTVGNKANQSQVTQLAGQISTKVESATYSTKMTQLDSAINLRVVQGDITEAILADKKVKDTRGTNELPSWYYANYPQQTVTEFKQRTTMGVPSTAQFVYLTTKILWKDASGGAIVQTAEAADGVFQRASISSGAAWGAWDKVAEAGKLISQINVSTEGILLQGKRIQLDGDVTMTTAFINILDAKTLYAVYADIATLRTKFLTADLITSTHLKSDTALITKLFATDANIGVLTSKTAFINSVKAVTISADKITAGTLNASNVNIINLNASKIATGTMSGVNYSLNLNTGVETFRNPSNGSLLSIQQDKFYFDTSRASHYLIPDNEGLAFVPGANNTGNDRNAGIRLQSTNFNFVDLGFGSDGGFLHRIGSYPDTLMLINKDGGDFTFSHTGVLDVGNANTRRWDLKVGNYGQFQYGKTAIQFNGYDTSTIPKLKIVNPATGALATLDVGYINLGNQPSSVELSNVGTSFKIEHVAGRNWIFADGLNGTLTYGITRLALNGHNNASARLSVYGAGGTSYGYMSAANFDVQSERKYKDDITDFGGALSIISTMKIHQYTKNGKPEIGIITDEAPLQLLADNDTKVSLYDYASLAVRGVQELGDLTWNHETKIKQLEERIKQLESEQ